MVSVESKSVSRTVDNGQHASQQTRRVARDTHASGLGAVSQADYPESGSAFNTCVGSIVTKNMSTVKGSRRSHSLYVQSIAGTHNAWPSYVTTYRKVIPHNLRITRPSSATGILACIAHMAKGFCRLCNTDFGRRVYCRCVVPIMMGEVSLSEVASNLKMRWGMRLCGALCYIPMQILLYLCIADSRSMTHS
jgi:hypothetical protein